MGGADVNEPQAAILSVLFDGVGLLVLGNLELGDVGLQGTSTIRRGCHWSGWYREKCRGGESTVPLYLVDWTQCSGREVVSILALMCVRLAETTKSV